MQRKTIAGLFVLASVAACGPARQPVASAPAPAAAPVVAPPPPPLETVAPVEAAAPTGTSATIGADLLGSVRYDMPVPANLSVRNELEFLVYQRHEVVAGWLRAGERYGEFARDVFASYGVPRDLYHLGMIESGFRPTVRSHAGAVGMWQFMPATGRGMGLRIDTLVDERMDPVRSTHAAARHLRDLHRRFRGDWSLAAAAYNAGEGRINRGLGRFGVDNFWDLANRGDLAQETRRYVPRLYATTIIARDPVRFGYPAPNPSRRFAYDSIRVDLATPLSVLAAAGNLPLNELTELNPHLFRQVAPRDYWVWVPAGQGRALQQAYQGSEFRQRGGFGSYRVREGDSLTRLAELSGVSAEQIRSLNLSANTEALRPGTTLRLYADAARVLNARPAPRVARSEPAPSRPRVLGDPETPAESTTRVAAASTGERREEPAASRPSTSAERRTEPSPSRPSTSAGERRSAPAASSSRPGTSSSERRSTESSSTGRTSTAAASGSARTSERPAASSSTASERRSGSGTAERSATAERRSGTAETPARRPAAAESGSARTGERASASSSTRRGEGRSSSARTHTVADGETLWGIARRYEVTVDAVREANGMENETIRPGQTLRIPRAASSSATAGSTRTESGSSRPAASATTASERSASTARPSTSTSGSTATRPATTSGTRTSAAARRREHTVGDGETLWGIARRYETTVDSLRRANDLEADEQIQPGQKLTIPES
jgi:membrane-bound lytic murein transglycosylase D